MILCVAPNPSIDKLFAVEQLRPGAIHRPAAFTRVAGGKGLNVARAAAALGADVHAVALLGGHAGRWVEQALRAGGVELTAVWTEHETRSCLSVADLGHGGLTEFYEDGAPAGGAAWGEFIEQVNALAAEATWTTVSGSLPPDVGPGGYAELAAVGRVVIDSRAIGDAAPSIVKVNALEAEMLTGIEVESTSTALEAARCLVVAGAGAAIVTRGTEGVVAIDPDGRLLEGTLAEVGPFPVGSGDAFLAGLVVALEQNQTWERSLACALGAGAANALMPGAGCLERARAEELAVGATVHIVAE